MRKRAGKAPQVLDPPAVERAPLHLDVPLVAENDGNLPHELRGTRCDLCETNQRARDAKSSELRSVARASSPG
jgi:hypothetical protein